MHADRFTHGVARAELVPVDLVASQSNASSDTVRRDIVAFRMVSTDEARREGKVLDTRVAHLS